MYISYYIISYRGAGRPDEGQNTIITDTHITNKQTQQQHVYTQNNNKQTQTMNTHKSTISKHKQTMAQRMIT